MEAGLTCGSCGHANRAGRKFCAECGSALAVACAVCGAANEAGERFCGECGAPLAATPPKAPLLEEAGAIFERLRAAPWLERLAAAGAALPESAVAP